LLPPSSGHRPEDSNLKKRLRWAKNKGQGAKVKILKETLVGKSQENRRSKRRGDDETKVNF
jgi:hypothetical protein